MDDLAHVWRRPGTLPTWATWLVAIACGITILIAGQGLHALYGFGGYATEMNRFWFCNGLALGITATLSLAWLPGWRMSRALRVAVLLPLVQLVALGVTAALWRALAADLAAWGPSNWNPQAQLAPITSALIALAAIAVVAIAIKRRHGEWAHAAVMLALSTLLLVGLWLPLASNIWISGFDEWRVLEATTASPWHAIAFAVVPPFVLAVAYTALAFRRPYLFARYRQLVTLCVSILFGISVVAQMGASDASAMLYLNLVHVVLIAALVAIVAIVGLGVATWVASRLAHRALRGLAREYGVISGDDSDVVASLQITSWLRGPALVTRGFEVTSARGEVPVSGASVLAHVPAATTDLAIGERAALLAVGDPIVIAGRTSEAGDNPFRTMDATEIAYVAVPGSAPYRFADLALVLWRPAVAYLAILVAVAVPGLVCLLK